MGSRSSRTETRRTSARRPAAARATATPPPATVVVGRILRAHGLRGELVVAELSDVPDRLAAGSECLLVEEGRPGRPVRILGARRLGRELGLILEGCADRDAAEELRGAFLEIAISQVPAAPSGSYWQHELLGCQVVDERDGDLGVVAELVDAGGGVLLAVARGAEGKTRLLVPFAAEYLVRVDVAARRIDLALPEGLIEACESR